MASEGPQDPWFRNRSRSDMSSYCQGAYAPRSPKRKRQAPMIRTSLIFISPSLRPPVHQAKRTEHQKTDITKRTEFSEPSKHETPGRNQRPVSCFEGILGGSARPGMLNGSARYVPESRLKPSSSRKMSDQGELKLRNEPNFDSPRIPSAQTLSRVGLIFRLLPLSRPLKGTGGRFGDRIEGGAKGGFGGVVAGVSL